MEVTSKASIIVCIKVLNFVPRISLSIPGTKFSNIASQIQINRPFFLHPTKARMSDDRDMADTLAVS